MTAFPRVSYHRRVFSTLSFLLLFVLVAASIFHLFHHFIDYPVYELAGRKVLERHASELYDLTRQTPGGFYYSYFFAFIFAGIACLGAWGGKIFFLLLLWASYLKTLDFSVKKALYFVEGRTSAADVSLCWLLTVLLTTYSANDAFMNANIGVLLLALILTSYDLRERHPVLSGVLLGAATVFKVYPIVLLGFFIWERRLKVACAAMIAIFFFYVGVPILIEGKSLGLRLIRDQWVVLGNFGHHWSYGSLVFQNLHGTVIRYASLVGLKSEKIFMSSVIASTVIVFGFYLRSFLMPSIVLPARFRRQMFVLCLALVPFLVPVSWYNMGLFYSPMIAYLVAQGVCVKDRKALFALGVYALLFCLTTPDIVGKGINDKLEFFAVPFLGVCALFTIYVHELIERYRGFFFFATER